MSVCEGYNVIYTYDFSTDLEKDTYLGNVVIWKKIVIYAMKKCYTKNYIF